MVSSWDFPHLAPPAQRLSGSPGGLYWLPNQTMTGHHIFWGFIFRFFFYYIVFIINIIFIILYYIISYIYILYLYIIIFRFQMSGGFAPKQTHGWAEGMVPPPPPPCSLLPSAALPVCHRCGARPHGRRGPRVKRGAGGGGLRSGRLPLQPPHPLRCAE